MSGRIPVWLDQVLYRHDNLAVYRTDTNLLTNDAFPEGVPLNPDAVARGLLAYVERARPRSEMRARAMRLRDFAIIYGPTKKVRGLTLSKLDGERTPRWLVELLTYPRTKSLRPVIAKLCATIDGDVVPMTVAHHIIPYLERNHPEQADAVTTLRELLVARWGDAPGMPSDPHVYLVVDTNEGIVSVHVDATTAFDDAERWARAHYAEEDLAKIEEVEVRRVRAGERLV